MPANLVPIALMLLQEAIQDAPEIEALIVKAFTSSVPTPEEWLENRAKLLPFDQACPNSAAQIAAGQPAGTPAIAAAMQAAVTHALQAPASPAIAAAMQAAVTHALQAPASMNISPAAPAPAFPVPEEPEEPEERPAPSGAVPTVSPAPDLAPNTTQGNAT